MNYQQLAKTIIAPLYRIEMSDTIRTVAKNRVTLILESTPRKNHFAARKGSGQIGSILSNNRVPKAVIAQIRSRLHDVLMERELGL